MNNNKYIPGDVYICPTCKVFVQIYDKNFADLEVRYRLYNSTMFPRGCKDCTKHADKRKIPLIKPTAKVEKWLNLLYNVNRKGV